jgi:7-carboxy-7-deazaguanine synthase
VTRLKLTEIFYSLQGEADSVGIPTVFVRLTGCPLRCQYCDTTYAFHGGEWWEIDAILARVAELGGAVRAPPNSGRRSPAKIVPDDFVGAKYVCVTGGEPLAQKNCIPLLQRLCDAGYRVSLETSGAMSLEDVDPRVVRVVDVKTPASGEESRNRYDELGRLQSHDLVKFVICGRADYEWSRAKLREMALDTRCTVLFSPSHEELPARELADWILEDRLPVRFQIQLHKYLWGNVPGK